MLTVGSLFSGYGGLELGIARVLDADVVWHAEIEPAANRVLRARFPGVPNLGDVSQVDWTHGYPSIHVDVLAGGFPCQDVSPAGLRRGLRPGTRSGLWSEFVRAIAALRPSLVIVENVRGLTSAPAHRPMESDRDALGDPPFLRALGADLGFDADWIGLRASDVGAPHRRFRIFLAAYPRGEAGLERTGLHPGGETELGRSRPHDGDRPTPDPVSGQPERRRGPSDLDRATPPTPGERHPQRDAALPGRDPTLDWGPYGAAIRRWEALTGYPAPSPTETGRDGGRRTSPAFVEWMMGLEPGWVTAVPLEDELNLLADLMPEDRLAANRAEQLRLLGNGVVPQQAEHAIRLLLARGR